MSIVRIGLGETKNFAEGYDAIFGKKDKTEEKKEEKPAGEQSQQQDKKKKEEKPAGEQSQQQGKKKKEEKK